MAHQTTMRNSRSESDQKKQRPGKNFGAGALSWVDSRSGAWDFPTVIVTLDAKRRLTLPAGLVPAVPGDTFEVQFDAEDDAVVFRRLPGKEDWLKVLEACPVSMDDLPARRSAPAKRRKL
jgi:hypothetical protein